MMATTCNNIEANFTPQSFQLRQAIRSGRITEHNAIFIYYLTQLVAEVRAKISSLILHEPESTNTIAAQPVQYSQRPITCLSNPSLLLLIHFKQAHSSNDSC